MARSGRDYSHDDHRQPVGAPLPEPSIRDTMADQRRSGVVTGVAGNQLSPTAEIRVRPASPRRLYPQPDRERPYSLRDSELGTLVEIATFRAVTLHDLTSYRYAGNEAQATGTSKTSTGRASSCAELPTRIAPSI
jgi:hypothetical protein